MEKRTFLYIGGFQLPDKNAAAHRVVSNAKALRELGHTVVFLNALADMETGTPRMVSYYGFNCYEYQRESLLTYSMCCRTVVRIIERIAATDIIAYNYPAVALVRLRRYCLANGIRCYADATEWYHSRKNLIFRLVKSLDTNLRMRSTHPRLDGVIAISEYLYRYYRNKVKTVKIPPLVDVNDAKWTRVEKQSGEKTTFIYAGAPAAQKERLDLLVSAVDHISQKRNISLTIIGITREEYEKTYKMTYSNPSIDFIGWVSNQVAIDAVKKADWMVVVRDNNQLVRAGFPTKVVESITCGTPVIANRFSNIADYLDKTNSILFDDLSQLEAAILAACDLRLHPDTSLFDYRCYVAEINEIVSQNESVGQLAH